MKSRLTMLTLLIFEILLNPLLAQIPSEGNVKTAMHKAAVFLRSISTYGGYAGIYSADLKERFGEAEYEPAAAMEIWVQPPGTPTVGESFLRAYRATGESFYLDAAKEAALALAWGQREAGGWDHRVDLSHFQPLPARPVRQSGFCAFDDKITQGALAFLMKLDAVLDEPWLSDAVEKGLGFLMNSQFENGAWPQWYPLRGGYHDYFTFNDNAINDCMNVLIAAQRQYGRQEYLDAAMKGGDFIVLSQLSSPQPGWAQQYSHDLKPAWARAFEPPAVCSAVTARNINTLIDLYLYTGAEKYLAPIPRAFDWLDASRIGGNLWARLYEVGTNRPIYGDRDNKVHYTLAEISEERRTGYSWQGSYGIPETRKRFDELRRLGRAGLSGQESAAQPDDASAAGGESLPAQVEKVLSSLDDAGRWIENNRITCQAFVRNFGLLCRYLESR